MKDLTESPPQTNGIATSPSSINGDAPCLGSPAEKTISNGFTDDDFPPELEPSVVNVQEPAKIPTSLSRTSSCSSTDLNFRLDTDDEFETPTKTSTSNDVGNDDDLESTHDPKTNDVSTAATNDKSMYKDSFEDCLTVYSHNKEIDDSTVVTTTCLESNSVDTEGNEKWLKDSNGSLLKCGEESKKGLKVDDICLPNHVETTVSQLVIDGQDGESESIGMVLTTELGKHGGILSKTKQTSGTNKAKDEACISVVDTKSSIKVVHVRQDSPKDDNKSVEPVAAKCENLDPPVEPTQIESDEVFCLSPNVDKKACTLPVDESKEFSSKELKESNTCVDDGPDQRSKLLKSKHPLTSKNDSSSSTSQVSQSNPIFKETKGSILVLESNRLDKNANLDSLKSSVLDESNDTSNARTECINENPIDTSCTEPGKKSAVSVSDKSECLLEVEKNSQGAGPSSNSSETPETQVLMLEHDSSFVSKGIILSSVLEADIVSTDTCANTIDDMPNSSVHIKNNDVLISKDSKCGSILLTKKTDLIEREKKGVPGSLKDSSILSSVQSSAGRIDELTCELESESVSDDSTKKCNLSLEESLHKDVDAVVDDFHIIKKCNIKTSLKNGMTPSLKACEEVVILETSANDGVTEPIVQEICVEEETKSDTSVARGSPLKSSLSMGGTCEVDEEVHKEVKDVEKCEVEIKTHYDNSKQEDQDNKEFSLPFESETFPIHESKTESLLVDQKEETTIEIVVAENGTSIPNSESDSKDNLPQPLDTISDQAQETQPKEKSESDDSDPTPESEMNGTSESICTDTKEDSTTNLEYTVEIKNVRVPQSQADAEILAKENGVPTADEQKTSNICSEGGNDGILISSDNDDSMGLSGVGQKRSSSVCDEVEAKRAKLLNGHSSDFLTNGTSPVEKVENLERGLDDEKKIPSKRPSESSNSLETKKARASSDVSLSTEQVSKILTEEANSKGKSPIMSSLINKPQSNMDKAIERVAFGGLDKKERILMPLLRDLKNRKLANITRDDLEELVSQRLCELVTECGDLFQRERVQKLEQSVEHWKLKAASLQKQMTDMTMVFKKLATETKQNSGHMQIPIKITRSVGLQVVMPTWQSTGKNISPHLKNGFVQTNKRKSGGIMTNRNTTPTILYPPNTNPVPPGRPPVVQKVVTPSAGTPSPTRSPQGIARTLSGLPGAVRFRPPNSSVATGTGATSTVMTTAGVRTVPQPRPVVKSVTVPAPDNRVIDLTDEDDRTKRVVQTMRLANVNGNAPTSGNTIRIVSPQQLTGTSQGVANVNGQRLAYMLPASAGNSATGRLQLFTQQPGGSLVAVSRPSHMPTLMLKNGTVMSSAGGSVPGNIIRTAAPNVYPQVVARGRPAIRMTNGGLPPRPVASIVASPLNQHAIRGDHHVVRVGQHPAPLPPPPSEFPSNPSWKKPPPRPDLKISKVDNRDQHGIILSWNMDHGTEHEEIASYQLYAYQENSGPPTTSQWKKVGDVKAMPLPMACTLTQFLEGNKYHFAVRAIDIHSRCGLFSSPGHIILPVRTT